MTSKKEAEQLVRDLRRYFKSAGSPLTIEARGGHWHVVNENGKSLARFATTPSDHRFRQNTIGDLRRRGIVPPDFR
jgi:hypothetical protein